MKLLRLLAALIILSCGLCLAAFAQEQIALSIYVHEGNINGTMLSGVQITGQDTKGGSLEATTDESGIAILKGLPGSWQLAFQKSGYQTLELTYDALQTEEVAAYLERRASSDPITVTLYIFEGSMDGEEISGVQITGKDAAGSEFAAATDSSGSATISGTPGSWELTLTKAGYVPVINYSFEATESEDLGAYLEKAA